MVTYFQDFPNSCHINMSFSMEIEKENKLSFLDIEIICEQDKFTKNLLLMVYIVTSKVFTFGL